MGMLDAFLRGAAGQGLVDLSRNMNQRDAEERANKTRQQQIDEERAWRAAEAQKERESRATSAARRTSSGGGGDDEAGDVDRYAVAEVMKREGVSEGEARALIQASRAGTNPLTRNQNVTEQIDEGDGRTRNATRQQAVPDMERWARVNQAIARALETGVSKAKSNYDQLTQGEGNDQRNTMVGGMLAGKLAPAQTAEGVAASKGEGAYGKGNVNQFSGSPDAVGKSIINENNAQAGSAGRANRDPVDDLKLPAGVKARIDLIKKRADQINAAITKAQADGMWDTAANPSQARLETELAALDKEARDLLKPHLPKPQVDPAQARREAEAAVAAGASLDKVNERLKAMGLEPIAAKPGKPAEPGKPGKPAEPPAKTEEAPGMLARIKAKAGEVMDAVTEDPKVYVERRVAEAKKPGGKPLTPGEKQLAQKYGITV